MNSKLRYFLLRLSAIAMIFLIAFMSTKAFALDNITNNLFAPIISEDFDIGKFAGTVVGWIMAIVASLLWVFTRLMSFIFKFIGGIMYGFFINNPLDTEIAYIRPLWSFMVDFGNLVVIGSFIALALVILFDIDLPVSKDLPKFAGGIVMIALLLNFSLTMTSAFASTIHSIGIGTVYATTTTKGTNLDLSSKTAFNKSVLLTGNAFFETVNNNFVESISCLGNGSVETVKDGKSTTKGMAAVCEFHGKDLKGQLNPISLISASDGSPEAFKFYLIVLIRELAVLILLAIGIFVIIKLLKVSVFRLAYLWLVGIFAGPALVAAFSPFDGMKKYFQTWLRWLVVFSTMMIVFVAGFYLSSYIATIKVPPTSASFGSLPDPLSDPTSFITDLVNTMIEIVVPTVMFPIVGIVILFLLGKYLDETYQQHAEKALKAGGKMLSEARNSVSSAGRLGAGVAGFGAGAALGGLKNVSNLGAGASNLKNTALLKANSALAGAQRLGGLEGAARATDSRAIKYAGKAAVSRQIAANRTKGIDDFVSGKSYKEKRAEVEYLGKQANADVLNRLGVGSGAFEAEAKKRGVKDEILNQGRAVAFNLKHGNTEEGEGANYKQRTVDLERAEAKKANSKNFDNDYASVQANLNQEAVSKSLAAEKNYNRNVAEYENNIKRDIEDIQAKRLKISNGNLSDPEKLKQNAALDTRESKHQAQRDKLKVDYDNTVKNIDEMRAKINVEKENNTIVTDAVNKKFLSENEGVKEEIAKKIYKKEKSFVNNSDAISARNKQATSQYTDIEAQAQAVFEQLKEIDKDTDESGNPKANLLSSNEKRVQRENLLNTIPKSNPEVRKIADRKYKALGSNLYGDE